MLLKPKHSGVLQFAISSLLRTLHFLFAAIFSCQQSTICSGFEINIDCDVSMKTHLSRTDEFSCFAALHQIRSICVRPIVSRYRHKLLVNFSGTPYIWFLPSSRHSRLSGLSSWMRSNRLQLNGAKTEALWCTSIHQQRLIANSPLFADALFN